MTDNEGLANLIQSQKQIKRLRCFSHRNINISNNIKKAILNYHSNSLIEYFSFGFNNLDYSVMEFNNL
ncbi:3766_t:CDS:1, partial [Entrophospora sp. SA101]